jgi:pyruvate dehydrogenase E2 component (dihydrolipoamide acetyltransferase)
MEFEAVDEGTVSQILVAEGTDNVKVGTVIALLEGEDGEPAPKPAAAAAAAAATAPVPTTKAAPAPAPAPAPAKAAAGDRIGDRIKASPLARRIAAETGVDLKGVTGTGPNGRIVKADVTSAPAIAAPVSASAPAAPVAAAAPRPVATAPIDTSIPHEVEKLSNMRKTIARRLTEAKATVPHYYLTIDIRIDALLKLRADLNKSLEPRGVKLSVNDLLIKALGVALTVTPQANVSFAGDTMIRYQRADVAVAVSIPNGLITPVITDAGGKSVSAIATEMKDLAARAKDGKLQPHEYQGGTASLSNLGMFGIKQFDAVINPPQGMILAVGAGEARPYVIDGALGVATVMTATGSFDHRAIDGAEGAQLMQALKNLIEAPLGLLA